MRYPIVLMVLAAFMLSGCGDSAEVNDFSVLPNKEQLLNWSEKKQCMMTNDFMTLDMVNDQEAAEKQILKEKESLLKWLPDLVDEYVDQAFWNIKFNSGCMHPLEYLQQSKVRFFTQDPEQMRMNEELIREVISKYASPILDDAGDCEWNCNMQESQEYLENYLDEVYAKNFSTVLTMMAVKPDVDTDPNYHRLTLLPIGPPCVITSISVESEGGRSVKRTINHSDPSGVNYWSAEIEGDFVESVESYSVMGCEVAKSTEAREKQTIRLPVAIAKSFDRVGIVVTVKSGLAIKTICENQNGASDEPGNSEKFRVVCGEIQRL